MKKILFAAVFFIGFLNYANACFCAQTIQSSFNALTERINSDIGDQTSSVTALIKEIKKNTKDINEQNEVIKKIIEGEKHKALQNTHIIFLLRKIVELKTAGEM